jgi:hypothetical protein
MTELILQGQTYIIDTRYLQGALAALVELGWTGISLDPRYSRVYEVQPLNTKSTVLLNQTAYQFPRDDKVARNFLIGARGVYQILGKEFSGRIYYNNNPKLDRDVLSVIAQNASPLTQLYMKHVAKTKLSPRTKEYEKLFREKNYGDLLILAANDGDIETVKKAIELYRNPMLIDVDADANTLLSFDKFKNNMSTPIGRKLMTQFNDTYHGTVSNRYFPKNPDRMYPPFALNNEAAAIAVSQNHLDILQLLDSMSPPNNHLTLMEIAAFLGYDDIIEYIRGNHQEYPLLFVVTFAIRGKQFEIFKKYLAVLATYSGANEYIFSRVYEVIFEYGTPEIYEYMKATGHRFSGITAYYHLRENGNLFRYLYLNNFIQYDIGKNWMTLEGYYEEEVYYSRFLSIMLETGIIEGFSRFLDHNNLRIVKKDLGVAIEFGNIEMLKFLLDKSQHRVRDLEIITVGPQMFRFLIDNGLIDSSDISKLSYQDWQTEVEASTYFGIPVAIQSVLTRGNIEFLQYYHQHYPEARADLMFSEMVIALGDVTVPFDFFIEFERLYGPLTFDVLKTVEKSSIIYSMNIEIVIYLLISGRMEPMWDLLNKHNPSANYTTTFEVKKYINQLHVMNQYAELVDLKIDSLIKHLHRVINQK